MTVPGAALSPPHYRFADVTLDPARRSVTRDGQAIELKSLDFDLLRFLVESAPTVVNADALAERVWGRHFVSPENVAQRVMLLRQSLSDDANRPRYIETVRNKGYRLIPAVEKVAAAQTLAAQQPRRWFVPATAATLLLAVGAAAATRYWLAETATQTPLGPTSVAVLPFENLSPDHADAYFAAGMQAEIVSQLTKIRGLRVFPVPPGPGAQRSIPDLARDLNVGSVLGGSVYYSEGRVRVTPRLTEVPSGLSLWSVSYEHALSDIFAIQSEIALDVAQALSLELSGAERERVERVPTTNLRALNFYWMARGRNLVSGRGEVLTALDEVEQAVELDPEFKEAWALVAGIRCGYAVFVDPVNTEEHRRRGEQAAKRALQLDPEFGAGHAALALALAVRKDWTGAEEAFRTAKNLNVPLGELGSYAFLHLSAGKFGPLARDIFEAERAAEPSNALFYRFLMFVHAGLGEWATANEFYESGLRLFPGSAEASRIQNQRMHWLIGRNDVGEARKIVIDDPFNAAMVRTLDMPREQALAALRREYEASAAGNPNHRRDIGLWAGHFGDPAFALEAMRAAIDEQSAQMVFVWLPQLASMRRLPEFKAYMREVGMVAYWQEFGWPPFCHKVDATDFECD